MRPLLVLSLVGTLALAQTPTEECQCPMVKCPGGDAVALCNCLNNRETLCKERCPDYIPTYLPCPMKPTSVPTSTPTPIPSATCECEQTMCVALWPQSCYCQNASKQKCFDKCGGEAPEMQACPPLSSPSLITKTLPTYAPSSFCSLPTKKPHTSTVSAPKPSGTHAPCGGNRSNYLTCDEGYICIKDPYKPGCGPECDGLGICVEDKMCGGFAGFSCQKDGQTCMDDPRDSCDPKSGGADCGGLCVWPH